MPRFLFWNINSLYPRANESRDFGPYVADIVREHGIDIVLLAERPESLASIDDHLQSVRPFFRVPSARRFGVFTAFSPVLMPELRLPLENDRVNIYHLALPLENAVVLALVHGYDRRNNDAAKREFFLEKLHNDIEWVERAIGHGRTVVVGDFNANP